MISQTTSSPTHNLSPLPHTLRHTNTAYVHEFKHIINMCWPNVAKEADSRDLLFFQSCSSVADVL